MMRNMLQYIGLALAGKRPDWRQEQGGPNIAPGSPGIQQVPMPGMYPGGFGTPQSDPGFAPAHRPRFPGDPGIDPGMTPPPDQRPGGPVRLGGRRTMNWRY